MSKKMKRIERNLGVGTFLGGVRKSYQNCTCNTLHFVFMSFAEIGKKDTYLIKIAAFNH